eukprot:10466850-Lingulodinium_polyedra.AAC.1
MATNIPYASPWLLVGRRGGGRGGRCIAAEIDIAAVPRRSIEQPLLFVEGDEGPRGGIPTA